MAIILEETTLLDSAGKGSEETEHHEAEADVVGLRIPRKRVLAMLNVDVEVNKLPPRTPRATYEWINGDE